MATTTPNFGWSVPTSTDLVKDGATAIETLGDAIDASLVDLKGGTTGQILAKNSSTDMDFTWSAAGMTNPMTTTGDTIYSSSGSTPARLGIGTTGQVLTVSGGLPAWTTPAGGGANWSLLNSGGTALTGATTITISGISGQDKLMILIKDASSANGSSDVGIRFNGDSTGANYQWWGGTVTGNATYAPARVSYTNGGDPYVKFASFSDTADSVAAGYLLISGCNASGVKVFNGTVSGTGGSGTNNRNVNLGGYYAGTSTISSVSLVSSSGNWDAGTVYIYASA